MKVIFLLVILVFSFFVSCNRSEETKKMNEAKSTEHIHKEEVWTCPMHPQIRESSPGKCPVCHMDLVKLENMNEAKEDDSDSMPEGHAGFKLSEYKQQLIGVKTGIVEKKELFKKIEASGKIAFDPELYTAQAEFIEAIKQKDRVKDSPISEVKHSADRMVDSAKLRLKVLGLSDEYIKNLQGKGISSSSLLIPKSGEKLWVYAEVFEMDLPWIRPGHKVKVSGNVLGHKILTGKVVSVDRVINSETRTAKVRILISDTKASLRPESFLDVTILSPLGEQITVPFDAILDTGKEAWVYVVKESHQIRPRPVTIIERAGDEVAIGDGLEVGEKIVTSANFLLDSESRLKGVVKDSVEKKLPDCPEGQFWHEQMNHCMDKP